MMNEYYTMESFGADCPKNWEEIATWLNKFLAERVTDDMDDRDIREIADAIWEAYWGGLYAKYDAPAPSEELWGEEEDEDEEEDDEMETKLWYAVMRDLEDSDWGTGSYDLDEARAKVAELREDGYADAYIAVIDMHNEADPVCVEEIHD